MPYIITEACIGVKDKACVDVCPVDCIYEGEQQLFIHPDECIDCGACEPECPVTAIFPEEDVPANMKQYVQINRDVFKSDNPPNIPTSLGSGGRWQVAGGRGCPGRGARRTTALLLQPPP
jgi:NAD-dependent dihydropyrimidine dehydrogenase PreA subunit